MVAILSESKYNKIKEYIGKGKLNREEIAKRLSVSHTLVSRVNNTEDYTEYVNRFTLQPKKSHKASVWERIKEFFS